MRSEGGGGAVCLTKEGGGDVRKDPLGLETSGWGERETKRTCSPFLSLANRLALSLPFDPSSVWFGFLILSFFFVGMLVWFGAHVAFKSVDFVHLS